MNWQKRPKPNVAEPRKRSVNYESEVSPRILLYYADHPDEATKLVRMSSRSAYIALGKLEAILSAPPEKSVKEKVDEPEEKVTKPVKQPEVSKAPAPISP